MTYRSRVLFVRALVLRSSSLWAPIVSGPLWVGDGLDPLPPSWWSPAMAVGLLRLPWLADRGDDDDDDDAVEESRVLWRKELSSYECVEWLGWSWLLFITSAVDPMREVGAARAEVEVPGRSVSWC